jgi:hypothetical protein
VVDMRRRLRWRGAMAEEVEREEKLVIYVDALSAVCLFTRSICLYGYSVSCLESCIRLRTFGITVVPAYPARNT